MIPCPAELEELQVNVRHEIFPVAGFLLQNGMQFFSKFLNFLFRPGEALFRGDDRQGGKLALLGVLLHHRARRHLAHLHVEIRHRKAVHLVLGGEHMIEPLQGAIVLFFQQTQFFQLTHRPLDQFDGNLGMHGAVHPFHRLSLLGFNSDALQYRNVEPMGEQPVLRRG